MQWLMPSGYTWGGWGVTISFIMLLIVLGVFIIRRLYVIISRYCEAGAISPLAGIVFSSLSILFTVIVYGMTFGNTLQDTKERFIYKSDPIDGHGTCNYVFNATRRLFADGREKRADGTPIFLPSFIFDPRKDIAHSGYVLMDADRKVAWECHDKYLQELQSSHAKYIELRGYCSSLRFEGAKFINEGEPTEVMMGRLTKEQKSLIIAAVNCMDDIEQLNWRTRSEPAIDSLKLMASETGPLEAARKKYKQVAIAQGVIRDDTTN